MRKLIGIHMAPEDCLVPELQRSFFIPGSDAKKIRRRSENIDIIDFALVRSLVEMKYGEQKDNITSAMIFERLKLEWLDAKLGIDKDQFYKKISRLRKLGIIESKRIPTQDGIKLCFKLTSWGEIEYLNWYYLVESHFKIAEKIKSGELKIPNMYEFKRQFKSLYQMYRNLGALS